MHKVKGERSAGVISQIVNVILQSAHSVAVRRVGALSTLRDDSAALSVKQNIPSEKSTALFAAVRLDACFVKMTLKDRLTKQ